MASWIIHLRVAEAVHNALNIEPYDKFVLGNIAPDSGVPSKDWTVFTPSAEVLHFRGVDAEGIKTVDLEKYAGRYMAAEQMARYDADERSFHLGYLTHLLTDRYWAQRIAYAAKNMFAEQYKADRAEFRKKIKRDWYDLDFIFLKEHPGFEAFEIYRTGEDFANRYLPFFSEDAFIDRREWIVGFYADGVANVRERPMYISKRELDEFVENAAKDAAEYLKGYLRK